MLDTAKKEMAIQILHKNWEEVLTDSRYDGSYEDFMGSLEAQVTKNCQGWDMSAEDFDGYYCELVQILGWEDLDGHEDEWESIVDEAARKFMISHGWKWEE